MECKSAYGFYRFPFHLLDVIVETLKSLNKKYPEDFADSFSEEIPHLLNYIEEETEITDFGGIFLVLAMKSFLTPTYFLKFIINNISEESCFLSL